MHPPLAVSDLGGLRGLQPFGTRVAMAAQNLRTTRQKTSNMNVFRTSIVGFLRFRVDPILADRGIRQSLKSAALADLTIFILLARVQVTDDRRGVYLVHVG